MKKRILVLLSVVALMVVMLATSVAPGFAGQKFWLCVHPTTLERDSVLTKAEKESLEARGFECTKMKLPKQPKPN